MQKMDRQDITSTIKDKTRTPIKNKYWLPKIDNLFDQLHRTMVSYISTFKPDDILKNHLLGIRNL